MRSLELDSDDRTELATTLAALSRAPNLEKVVLHHKVFQTCSFVAGDGKNRDLWDHFETSFEGLVVREVRLVDFTDRDAAFVLLDWRGSLSSLHLHYDLRRSRTSILGSVLAKALVTLPHLAELKIVVEDDAHAFASFDLSRLVNKLASTPAINSLKVLSISAPLLTPPIVTLATHFPQLDQLSLHSSSYSLPPNWQMPTFSNALFPQVRTLRLAGYELHDTINSISRTSFPSLRHLEVAPFEGDNVECAANAVLREMGIQLSTFRVHACHRLWPEDLSAIRSLASQVNPDLELFDTPDVPLFPSSPFFLRHLAAVDSSEPYQQDDVAACRTLVETLSAFLADEVRQAQRNNDAASFVGLAASLKAFELERLARIG
jgi:hypothetical protein